MPIKNENLRSLKVSKNMANPVSMIGKKKFSALKNNKKCTIKTHTLTDMTQVKYNKHLLNYKFNKIRNIY